MLKLCLESKRQQLSESIKYGKRSPRHIWPLLALWFVCALSYLTNLSPQLVEQSRLSYGRVRERAKWSESCVLIGYSSRKIGQSCPLGISPVSPTRKSSLYRSFIGQACSVNMDFHFVSVHKHAKKNVASIEPSWLRAWSVTICIIIKTIIMRCIN